MAALLLKSRSKQPNFPKIPICCQPIHPDLTSRDGSNSSDRALASPPVVTVTMEEMLQQQGRAQQTFRTGRHPSSDINNISSRSSLENEQFRRNAGASIITTSIRGHEHSNPLRERRNISGIHPRRRRSRTLGNVSGSELAKSSGLPSPRTSFDNDFGIPQTLTHDTPKKVHSGRLDDPEIVHVSRFNGDGFGPDFQPVRHESHPDNQMFRAKSSYSPQTPSDESPLPGQNDLNNTSKFHAQGYPPATENLRMRGGPLPLVTKVPAVGCTPSPSDRRRPPPIKVPRRRNASIAVGTSDFPHLNDVEEKSSSNGNATIPDNFGLHIDLTTRPRSSNGLLQPHQPGRSGPTAERGLTPRDSQPQSIIISGQTSPLTAAETATSSGHTSTSDDPSPAVVLRADRVASIAHVPPQQPLLQRASTDPNRCPQSSAPIFCPPSTVEHWNPPSGSEQNNNIMFVGPTRDAPLVLAKSLFPSDTDQSPASPCASLQNEDRTSFDVRNLPMILDGGMFGNPPIVAAGPRLASLSNGGPLNASGTRPYKEPVPLTTAKHIDTFHETPRPSSTPQPSIERDKGRGRSFESGKSVSLGVEVKRKPKPNEEEHCSPSGSTDSLSSTVPREPNWTPFTSQAKTPSTGQTSPATSSVLSSHKKGSTLQIPIFPLQLSKQVRRRSGSLPNLRTPALTMQLTPPAPNGFGHSRQRCLSDQARLSSNKYSTPSDCVKIQEDPKRKNTEALDGIRLVDVLQTPTLPAFRPTSTTSDDSIVSRVLASDGHSVKPRLPFPWTAMTVAEAKRLLLPKELQDVVVDSIREYSDRSHKLVVRDFETVAPELSKYRQAQAELHISHDKLLSQRAKLLSRHVTCLRAFNGAEGARFAETLVNAVNASDSVAEELVSVAEHVSRIERLRDEHWRAAASISLAKLNSSYLKAKEQNKVLEQRLAESEAGRELAMVRIRELEQQVAVAQDSSSKLGITPADTTRTPVASSIYSKSLDHRGTISSISGSSLRLSNFPTPPGGIDSELASPPMTARWSLATPGGHQEPIFNGRNKPAASRKMTVPVHDVQALAKSDFNKSLPPAPPISPMPPISSLQKTPASSKDMNRSYPSTSTSVEDVSVRHLRAASDSAVPNPWNHIPSSSTPALAHSYLSMSPSASTDILEALSSDLRTPGLRMASIDLNHLESSEIAELLHHLQR